MYVFTRGRSRANRALSPSETDSIPFEVEHFSIRLAAPRTLVSSDFPSFVSRCIHHLRPFPIAAARSRSIRRFASDVQPSLPLELFFKDADTGRVRLAALHQGPTAILYFGRGEEGLRSRSTHDSLRILERLSAAVEGDSRYVCNWENGFFHEEFDTNWLSIYRAILTSNPWKDYSSISACGGKSQ